ncbi:MAG: hypothetical protein KJO43_11575, partial [Phycisphaerae bacterium]|nr:hypothetical protein [Phycisphaerae bacterium]
MPVIKGVTADRATQRAVVLDLGDLKREAARIVELAHAEGDAIRARATAEAREIIDGAAAEGYDEGYARGLADGTEAGTKTGLETAHRERTAAIDTLVAGWGVTLDRWEEAFATMLAKAEHDTLTLALAIAEKIIFRVIDQQPDVVTTQVRATLAHLCRPGAVTIAVNPEDRPLVESTLPELLQSVQG